MIGFDLSGEEDSRRESRISVQININIMHGYSFEAFLVCQPRTSSVSARIRHAQLEDNTQREPKSMEKQG